MVIMTSRVRGSSYLACRLFSKKGWIGAPNKILPADISFRIMIQQQDGEVIKDTPLLFFSGLSVDFSLPMAFTRASVLASASRV